MTLKKHFGIVRNSEAPDALEASFSFTKEYQERLKMFLFREFSGYKADEGLVLMNEGGNFAEKQRERYIYMPLYKCIIEP